MSAERSLIWDVYQAYRTILKEKNLLDWDLLMYAAATKAQKNPPATLYDTIIVDEAQNTTIHELKTIITRTGKNSKIVLLGDTDQIDTPYIDSYSNGLTISVEKLKSSHLTSHITLERGERSELATLAGQML
jgi:hypothetical protein